MAIVSELPTQLWSFDGLRADAASARIIKHRAIVQATERIRSGACGVGSRAVGSVGG